MIWYCIPSKRDPNDTTIQAWLDAGYKVAIQRDHDEPMRKWPGVMVHYRKYSGYAEAVNYLMAWVLASDPEAEWLVTGGDDILPDPHKSPYMIALDCRAYFHGTFGVMQPIGDDFGANPNAQDPAMRAPYIHRVAGSPWIGREFAERINGGNGPLWSEYFHCGEDEELQAVATMLGIFWQRPDLTHKHMHWARPLPGERMAPTSRMPAFLERANSAEEWRKYKALFNARKAAGFPGHQPKE